MGSSVGVAGGATCGVTTLGGVRRCADTNASLSPVCVRANLLVGYLTVNGLTDVGLAQTTEVFAKLGDDERRGMSVVAVQVVHDREI